MLRSSASSLIWHFNGFTRRASALPGIATGSLCFIYAVDFYTRKKIRYNRWVVLSLFVDVHNNNNNNNEITMIDRRRRRTLRSDLSIYPKEEDLTNKMAHKFSDESTFASHVVSAFTFLLFFWLLSKFIQNPKATQFNLVRSFLHSR